MPIGHDPVPLLESSFGNVGTRVQNRSHIAVTHGQGLIEFGLNRLKRGLEAIDLDLVDHRLDFVRLTACFLDPPGLAKIHEHPLSTRRYQCSACSNQEGPFAHFGRRDFGQDCFSTFQALEDLQHWDQARSRDPCQQD